MGWQDDPIVGQATLQTWQQDPVVGGAPPPDKYQQAAQDQLAKLKAAGVDPSYGPAASALNGATFGALPTLMAGAMTPAEMIKHGTWSPSEGYSYAKANENAALASGNAQHPIANTVAGLGGGMMSGAGLAGAGLTATKAGAGLMRNAAGMAIDGAGYGAVNGALSGESGGRLDDAMTGAAGGAALGVAGPAIAKVAGAVAAPIVSNVMARMDPANAAKVSLARAILASGKTPEGLQLSLDNATAAGQPQYTLADALGKAGQDKLSSVVRSPGPGGVEAATFLDRRQAAQGRDVASALSDGLGVTTTADKLASALKAQRGADADAAYGAARSDPNRSAVDVSAAIRQADATLTPGVTALVNPNSNIADNSVEGAVRKAKAFLTDGKSNLSDFDQVLSAKREIDNMIDGATPTVQRALIPIKRSLDDALTASSPQYAEARDTFARQSRAMDAIDTGKQAARRGRPEDTIPAYGALEPGAQAAYRTGYADPILENASNGNPGANKALPLMNEGTQAELGAMSQYQGPQQPGGPGDIMSQRIARSNEMNATRLRALGGSQTADNLAHEKEGALEPGLLLDAAHGNLHGLAMALARKGLNGLTGSTPEVRAQLGSLLLTRGPAADVQQALAPTVSRVAAHQALARALGAAGGSVGGRLAIGAGSTGRQPQ